MATLPVRIATAVCFIGVALGAFGAHGLKASLEAKAMVDVWNKAVLYHLIHGVALFVLALNSAVFPAAGWLFVAGIFLFSGSLYLMAVTGQLWLGAVTPAGGLCFLAAWLLLFINGRW